MAASLAQDPEAETPGQKNQITEFYSRIQFKDLDDVIAKVAGSKGRPGHASISVLNPTIFAELLKPKSKEPDSGDPEEDPKVEFIENQEDYDRQNHDDKKKIKDNSAKDEDIVKITTSFTLEVSIIDFDKK